MTNRRSMDVTQDASAMGGRIDEMLRRFDDTLDTSSEIEWVPGDPLYQRPRGYLLGEQTVRAMFEEYHLDDSATFGGAFDWAWARCADCQVFWMGDEPCWVCGVVCDDGLIRQPLKKFASGLSLRAADFDGGDTQLLAFDNQVITYAAADVNATMELYQYWQNANADWLERYQRDMERGVRAFSQAFARGVPIFVSVMDEWAMAVNEAYSPTVTVNGITIPRKIPTTLPIPPAVSENVVWTHHPEAFDLNRYNRPTSHIAGRNRRPRNV